MSFSEVKGFNGKVSQCISRGLDNLGEGVRRSFYHQIQQKYDLPKEISAIKPEEVIDHLCEILGPTGSAFVERLIVAEIRKEFGLEFNAGLPLSTAIQEARRKFLDVSEKSI